MINKWTKILTLLFVNCFSFAFSQIPNAGFENWTTINGYENPENYITNNALEHISVAKTIDSYSGGFAMKISSTAAGIEGLTSGQARMMFYPATTFGVELFVKCDSLSDTGAAKISLVAYQNGVPTAYGYWETLSEIAEFNRIEIPLSPIGIYDSIHIDFTAFIANSSLGEELGFVSFIVDEIVELSELNSNSEIENFENYITARPNPCSDKFFIIANGEVHSFKYEIFDLGGEIIMSGNSNSNKTEINTQNLNNGTYILIMKSNNNESIRSQNIFFVKAN
jgi:hypothetical protein